MSFVQSIVKTMQSKVKESKMTDEIDGQSFWTRFVVCIGPVAYGNIPQDGTSAIVGV